MHWVLDVNFREDDSRTRERTLGNNLSWLRRFAVSLLKRHSVKDSLRGKMVRCMMNTAIASLRLPTGRLGLNRMSADGDVSRDPLNPLAPPIRCLEGVCEILCLVHDLTVAKIHNAHRECWSPLVSDYVFGDPEITFSEDSPDVET
jgi:hypothetical protein